LGASRLRAALSLGIAGALSLFAALLAHEILTFGSSGHGIIGRVTCPDWPCPTLSVITVGLVFKGIGAGLALACLGALLPHAPARLWGAGLLWVLQYLWGLVGIASGYRDQFGPDWHWWQPFAVLMWDPVTTPALLIAGLLACLGLDRLMAGPARPS
jgi:hypothetical protein